MQTAYSLSYGQQALWFIYREAPESAAYNMVLSLQFTQAIDPKTLQYAVQQLVERHPTLRTLFGEQEGMPYQQFADKIDGYWQEIHAMHWDEKELFSQVQHVSQQPFVLEEGVFRATLFCDAPSGPLLLLVLHHIAGDASSLTLLGQELLAFYAAAMHQYPASLPPLATNYSDYIRWETELLNGKKGERMAAYWQRKLAGEMPILQLPTDYPRPPLQTFNGASLVVPLPSEWIHQLKILAQNHKSTLFTALFSIYQILLHRYSGQSDIWVGVPTSIPRNQTEFTQTVGYLVNPMIVRGQFPPGHELTFSQLLQYNSQQILEGLYHQPYPFARLIEQLQTQRDPSYPPLVQVMFALELNDLIPGYFSAKEYVARRYDVAQMEGQFDLSLTFSEEADGKALLGNWRYNRDLFQSTTIARMAEHFRVLLEGVIRHAKQKVTDLSLLTESETTQLLQWNQTQVYFLHNQTVVDLFEQQVLKTPDHPAIVFEGQSLTYQQVNKRANQLAHHLLKLKHQAKIPDHPLIAIAVERSVEMVIGLLGLLKAGGAYIPIDPSYPIARIHDMLEDSLPPLLLTQSQVKAHLSLEKLSHPCITFCLDEMDHTDLPVENPMINHLATDLAYVIYTSGSTGKPKGVMIEHHSLSNFLQDMQQRTGITDQDKLLAVTTLSFDIAALELYLPLISGSTLYLATRDTASDGLALQKQLVKHSISFMQATPATWQLLKYSGMPTLPHLNILCGGEAFPLELAHYLLEKSRCVWNVYGPTETTIWSSAYRLSTQLDVPPPIGQPIANTRIYILDAQRQLQPPGLPGELCIAGTGLARGYLNRPELTAEKFCDVELLGQSERIYRTGDLARWLPNGQLECLGRLDHQIKLRGFRIELGEIEAALTQHPMIKEAAVIVSGTGDDKQLMAYFTTDSKSKTLVTELKTSLKARLPDYMIPSHFTVLEQLPLTANGKTDRKALSRLVKSQHPTTAIVLPETKLEQQLSEILQNILHVNSIDVMTQFFELGAHSLKLVQFQHRLQMAVAPNISIVELFKYNTIRQLANYLAHTNTSDVSVTTLAQRADKRNTFLRNQKRKKSFHEFR